MSNLTLRDIAKALNLSVSTVSKALHDSYEIGAATKQRVIDYAHANHYKPNLMAKSLKDGKSSSIGVVICSIDNNFVAQMLDGIDHACTQEAYDIIIMQSKESFEQEKSCLKQLEARGVEGILISPSIETVNFEHLTTAKNAGLPIVLFDRINEHVDAFQVGIDNHRSGYLATQHLIDNGHRKIAMLQIAASNYITSQRFEGYLQALQDNHIPYRAEYVIPCRCLNKSVMTEDVHRAIQSLFLLPEPPDALFTPTDQLSTQSLSTLHQLGYRIPADLALIGFSNTELADVLTPPLSTIYQPAFEIGTLAAEKLISLIKSKTPIEEYDTTNLLASLVSRKSSMGR